MPLESGSFPSDLNASNPAATDSLSQADDHIRLLKNVFKTTFPNIAGEVAATHTNLNLAADIAANGVSKLLDAGAYFAGDPNTGLRSVSANVMALRTNGADRVTVSDTGVSVTGAYSGGTGQLVPVGTILDYALSTAPTGFAMCYGQACTTSLSSALRALLVADGNPYGTNGTDPLLPDCRGRVLAGQDDMGGTSANRLTGLSGGVNGDTLGASGGEESHTLLEAETPEHTHDATVSTNGAHTHTVLGAIIQGGADGAASRASVVTNTTSSAGDHTHTVDLEEFGGDEAHNNVQPTLIVNKIIKI